MKKPNQLPEEIVTMLLPRLADEFKASYMYRAISNWCKNVGFNIAADYFGKESDDELIHAKKIENFLTDWNVSFALPTAQSAPKSDFKSLCDVIDMAYNAEYQLYESYEETSAKIFKTGDICAFDFLQQFRSIQTKSVAEYSDMLNMLEGCNCDSKFEMLLLEERLFKG